MAQGSSGGPGRTGAPTRELLVRQTKWFAAGQAVSDAVWYAMLIVLAALLPPQAFGAVAASMAIVRMANLVMESGTAGAIIAARTLTRQDVQQARRFNVFVGATLALVIAASAGLVLPLIAEGADPDVLRVLALAVLLGAFAVVSQALLRRSLDFRTVALVNGGSAIGTAVAAVAAALAGAGVWALVVRQVLQQGIVAILAGIGARRVAAELPEGSARVKPGWRLGAGPENTTGFLVVGGSALVAMTLDNIVVGAMTDARELGFYALAFTLGFAPLTQVSWRLGEVLFPAAAATAHLETVGRRTVRMMRLLTLLLCPLAALVVALAPAVVPSVFGSEWKPMVLPLQILIAVGVIHAIANVLAESLSGTGNIDFRAACDAPWAGLTLLGVGALAALFGVGGAAAAHLVSAAGLVAAYVFLGSRRIGSSPGEIWRRLRGVLGPAAAQLAVTISVLTLLEDAGRWTAGLVAAVAGAATFVALLAIVPSRPLADATELVRVVVNRREVRSGA